MLRLDQEKLDALYLLMEQSTDGRLHPERIVDAAADRSSVLHELFTWDDSVAAHAHRLNEARALCRYCVRVVPAPNGRPVAMQVFTRLQGESGYRSLQVALSTPDTRDRVLATALSELVRVRTKYAHLEELAAVFAEVDRLTA